MTEHFYAEQWVKVAQNYFCLLNTPEVLSELLGSSLQRVQNQLLKYHKQ
jgi:hypothetical protein